MPGREDDDRLTDDELVQDGDYELDDDEELDLTDDDEPLPWLEGDDAYEEEEGYDTPRLIAYALLALLALLVLIGGIWWLNRDRPDPEMVADGSTIEAPEGPYKERPEDPGGREVEGTGDTSFAVGEGEQREGRMAGSPAPSPSISRDQDGGNGGASSSGEADGASSSSDAGTAAASGGVGVQLGAFSSRENAQNAWNTYSGRYSALSGVKYRIVELKRDGGTLYALQAVAGSRSAASTLCSNLRGQGGDCQVK